MVNSKTSQNELLAVLLHGPSGVGKTAVGRVLLGGNDPIILDSGWNSGELRYVGGPARYADLKRNDDAIVFEIGCAEPMDLREPGATRNPQEWLQVIQREQRKLFAFKLWADWNAIEIRARQRNSNLLGIRLWYDLYCGHSELTTFPSSAGINELTIDTTNMTPLDVANEISVVVRRTRPFQRWP
jgi:hypothetical protein